MPTFEVTSPDGKKYRVNAPDGATREDALAYVKSQQVEAAPTAQDPFQQTAKSDTNTQNLLASIGGAMYAPYLRAKQMLGKATPQDIEEYKSSMGGLWSTPMGKVGTVAGGAATIAPLAMIPGANTALGAGLVGAVSGAMQPTGEGDSTALNTALGAGGGVLGKYAGDYVGKALTNRLTNKTAELAAQKAQNATRDATIREVQQAGYAIPPNQVRPDAPGLVNRVAEGLAGKIQTGQLAGIKNQPVTDALAKRALALPENIPLTADAIKSVRSTAGEAYKQLKAFGPIQTDQNYAAAMTDVAGEYVSLAKNFPSQKNGAIDSLLADLNKPTFNSSDAVELVKRLRHDGFKNITSQDPEAAALGKIQIGAQNAIEDLIDRNLAASGNADFLPVFRNARQMIAKSYTVEKALEDSTGKVVASKVGREFSKGRPLTGELATIGKMAEAFPKAVQNVNSSMPGLSPLDYAGGALGAMATGNPAGMLAPLARPIVRSAILSKPYQNLLAQTPSYEVGLLSKTAPKVMNDEWTKMLERAAMAGLLPTVQ